VLHPKDDDEAAILNRFEVVQAPWNIIEVNTLEHTNDSKATKCL
jgi:hypothetical protein